jgi:hypothetical protein
MLLSGIQIRRWQGSGFPPRPVRKAGARMAKARGNDNAAPRLNSNLLETKGPQGQINLEGNGNEADSIGCALPQPV